MLKAIGSDLKSIFINPIILVMLVFASVVLILYIGGAYVNPYVNDIPIAVLDEDNSSLSRTVVNSFSNSNRFKMDIFCNSQDELKLALDNSKAQLGVYIPKGFSTDVKALNGGTVLLVINGNNVIIGNNAYAAAAEVVQTIAAGVQIKLLEGKNLQPDAALKTAVPFTFNDRVLYDSKMTYMNYLIFGFITIFFQQLMLSALGQLFIPRGGELAKKHTALRLFILYVVSFLLFTISLFSVFSIVHNVFKTVIRGNVLYTMPLFFIFGFAIFAIAVLLSAVVKDKIRYLQICYLFSLPTFASCGYVWPIDQIPQNVSFVIKLFWPIIYFSRNIDEYLTKGVPPHNMANDMFYLILFGIIWFGIAVFVFKHAYRNRAEETENGMLTLERLES